MNLKRYSGSGSCIPWHSDNESLFGPPNQPKLTVSVSSGHSVVFQVRPVPGDVPSSIALGRGDVLVMDGLAQSEYAHHTVPGLQQPWVDLTFRGISQHTASFPQASVVGCVLPTCAQGGGENKWSSSWGLVLLLSILVSVLLVSTWIHIRRGHRHSGQRLSRSVAHFSSRGRARWVGGRRWRLSRRRQSSKGVSFYFPFVSFGENKLYSFSMSMVFGFCLPLGMLVAKREPTPCYHDAYSVGTPNRTFRGRGKAGKCIVRPRFSPSLDVSFW